ncbi:hypothetical protein [Streptomyces capillispiralis]|uniref:Uncharacterized protein n=1 Tax=Streptomyces capillispiralis TaxID=68182 RepID=A0A561SGV6_9ACTN|nr:hypothetical protein [Streptomyces capillispiralis]TWF74099.1 hypothetical protein FHX78_12131 [Streptomyces capillispiralis]GHE24272.1 hypothetical protein GCM10017779_71870 [Streptomyces capillispiralis]
MKIRKKQEGLPSQDDGAAADAGMDVSVILLPSGVPFINGNRVPVPEGREPEEMVLDTLYELARTHGAPVRAQIDNRQERYTAVVQIASDGSSRLLAHSGAPEQTADPSVAADAPPATGAPDSPVTPAHQAPSPEAAAPPPAVADAPEPNSRPGRPAPPSGTEAEHGQAWPQTGTAGQADDGSVPRTAPAPPAHEPRPGSGPAPFPTGPERTPEAGNGHAAAGPAPDRRRTAPADRAATDPKSSDAPAGRTEPAGSQVPRGAVAEEEGKEESAVPAGGHREAVSGDTALGEMFALVNEAIARNDVAEAHAVSVRLREMSERAYRRRHPDLWTVIGLEAYTALLARHFLRAMALSLELADMRREAADPAAWQDLWQAALAWDGLEDRRAATALGRTFVALWARLAADGPAPPELAHLLERVRRNIHACLWGQTPQ